MPKVFKPASGQSSAEVEKEKVKGIHATNKVVIMCLAGLLAIALIGSFLLIYFCVQSGKDYTAFAATVSSIVTAATGAIGFFAGQKLKSSD